MKHVTALAVALLLPASAWAGQSEADACANSLNTSARQIYSAAAPHVTPGSNLRDVVRQHTRNLVQSGVLSRSEARANAKAAGLCLQKLQS